jgi:Flp pilus assembly protein TadG
MNWFVREQRADTLLEFAVVAAVFFTTLFGILEVGQAVFRYNAVAFLAKEGARRAAVCGSNTGLSSTECNILTYVQGRSMGLPICNTCVTTTPTTLSTMSPGVTVAVRVQHSFRPLTGYVPLATLTFSSTAQMIVAR